MHSASHIASAYLQRQADAKNGLKTGPRDSVGLFIPLPADLAQKFPSLGSDDKSPPHVTFLYIGKVSEAQEPTLLKALSEAFQGKGWPQVRGKLDHLDHFQHADKERNVAHMAVRFSHPLAELRERVRSHLEDAGVEVGDSFPVFRPHATLEYMPGLKSTYKGEPVYGEWDFDTIEVWGLPKLHKIQFNPRGKTAFVAEDGWDRAGAHRFVLWPDDKNEEAFLNGPVRSLFERSGYTTGRVKRDENLGIEFLAERVASAHVARMDRRPLDVSQIEKFRKDFLMLMKNVKVVKDYDQAWKWREAVLRWNTMFDQFVLDRARKAIKDLRFQERIPKSDGDYWDKKLGADVWDLHINFRVPLEPLSIGRMTDKTSTDEELKAYLFIKMQRELGQWDGRVKRAARKAWKSLNDFVQWYKHHSETPLEVGIPMDERVNMEGFQVVVKGFDPDSSISGLYAEGMEQFKAGLKRYKQRAQAVLPLLLRGQLPLVVDFTMGLDEGGVYMRDHIGINPMAAHKNTGRMAQILAHEMGHHVYKTYLSKADQDFWTRAITGNYGTLDLNDVLRKYGNESFFDDKRIKKENPILYLQIQGLFDMPEASRVFQNILSMDSLRKYLANGGQSKWRVHGKPITGYGHKNNEEAFCEALGMLVGYGPQTVLPEVRSWLKTILPQIKVANLNNSWLELPEDVLYRAETDETLAENDPYGDEDAGNAFAASSAGRVASLYLDASSHRRSISLMKFLSEATRRLGVAQHVYVVGGAVRNFVIDQPIKDIDVVIDSVSARRDSDWYAKELARQIPAATDITTNQYGVAILTVKGDWELEGENMKGEVIEIANARSESYAKGEGYKPTDVQPATIQQDMLRREFTFNTLMWRMLDLAHGPDKAEIIDLTGCGLRDLQEGSLKCPSDPDQTFSDDPSRMLRAIKFTGKYGFKIPKDVAASIKRNAKKMKRMPWEAIGKILVENVLNEPSARKSLKQMKELGLLDVVSEMIQEQKPFATYMANQLRKNRKVALLLDLMDLGVPASTPLHFLTPKQRIRVRDLTVAMPENAAAQFADKLIKPPVNNQAVIDALMLPGPQRRNIQPLARDLILEDPRLADDPRKLTEMVIKRWT